MSSSGPLVKINSDSPERIAQLYGISPSLAVLIVRDREIHGYFRGPEDLASLGGIGRHLAFTLDPHIDWSAPVLAGLEVSHERSWFWAIVATVSNVANVWILVDVGFPGFYDSWLDYQNDPSAGLTPVIEGMLLVVGLFFALVATSIFAVRCLAEDGIWVRRFARLNLAFSLFAVLGFSTGIFIDLVREALTKQYGVLYDPWFFWSISVCVVLLFSVVPFIVVLWRPSLVNSALIARMPDVAILIGGPVWAWFVWNVRSDPVPLWLLLVWVAVAFYFLYVGVRMLYLRESMFPELLAFHAIDSLAQEGKRDQWLRYLAVRGLTVEQQKELQGVLNGMYPISRVRAVSAAVVISVAVFTFQAAVGAIIEKYVQEWWDWIFA